MRTPTRYLLWCAGGLVGSLLLCGSFAVLIDPYYVFGTATIIGVNRPHPRANDLMIASRAHLAERMRPRTLLLGNSRIEAGVDPASSAWPRSMAPVFNGGLPGMGLDAAQRVVEAAIAGGRLNRIVVAVEFLDTMDDTGGASPASPITMGSRALAHWFRNTQDWLHASLTIAAFADSVQTALSQGATAINVIKPDGSAELGEYTAYIREHGGAALFERKLADYRAQFATYRPTGINPRNATFTALTALLEVARANHSSVDIIIYPYHAVVLDLLREDGLWSSFEQFKRALVDIVWQRFPNTRIVDFSGYNAFTAEPLPPAGPGLAMHWYWEPGHFRTSLGDKMINRLYGKGGDFGGDLTPATIDAVLAAIRQERDERLAATYSSR